MPGTLSNENGSVMLFTLMFILIITVMGLIATQTSVFEIKIVENSRRYSEEFGGAEAALNHAIANFRNLKDPGATTTVAIAKVLNDTQNSDHKNVFYENDSDIVFTDGSSHSVANVEIKRIWSETLDCFDDGADSDCLVCKNLEPQSIKTPVLSHRYYAGSIDKRRFAVTATAYRRNSTNLSSTWVQKGISLPAEQDKDIF